MPAPAVVGGILGSVPRIRNLPEEDRRKGAAEDALHAIGKSESRIIRCREAFGQCLRHSAADYVFGRVRHFAERRIDEKDRAYAEKLKSLRYCGLGGLPGRPPDDDDIPF